MPGFVLLLLAALGPGVIAQRPPNLVVICIDDLGYADIGPFGQRAFPTPNLDRMAREGRRFTDFIVSSAVCSASRAALLTGCYHVRVGIHGALGPRAENGIAQDETTLAEVCKQRDYATACFGKWHLGHHPKFLPLQHGFDDYFGLPYSNDMWPLHPDHANLPPDAVQRKQGYPPLPLLAGNAIADAEVTAAEQAQLTAWYTERAVDFVARNKARPFFLYLAHSMVHVPLFVSPQFAGKSGHGRYGDAVLEIDWSVGQVLAALREHGVDDDTLVVFTSDNGPWLSYGDHAGSAGPLREGKGTMWEGGCRVPTLMRWPGRIPAGTTCDQLASTIDLLPTVAALLGVALPAHPIDGKDIRPLLFGDPGATTPHEVFCCFYAGGELQAVRDQRWKLHFPHAYQTLAGRPGGKDGAPAAYVTKKTGLELYDLQHDVGETKDVAPEHPEVVARLQQLAERARADLGDKLQDRKGAATRACGKLGEGDGKLVW